MLERRVLSIDPLKCNGCGECETACSMRQAVMRKGTRSRIEVLGGDTDGEGFHVPSTCQQCINPPCLRACPRSAIRRDSELERVLIDETLCVGCRMCVSACPSGAMGFDAETGLAYKCDLCDGDPQCVRACSRGAIAFVSGFEMHYPRMADLASRMALTVRCRPAVGRREA